MARSKKKRTSRSRRKSSRLWSPVILVAGAVGTGAAVSWRLLRRRGSATAENESGDSAPLAEEPVVPVASQGS